MKTKTKLLLLSLFLWITGGFILYYYFGFKLLFAIFLILWANNIQIKINKNN